MDNKQLLLVGVFVSFVLTLWFICKKMKDGFGSYNLKVYGITLIVFATLIVLLSDIPAEKTGACYGILGSIGGYLFGIKKDK